MLLLAMEVAQWTIIALLVVDNRKLRRESEKFSRLYAGPPRSVVED